MQGMSTISCYMVDSQEEEEKSELSESKLPYDHAWSKLVLAASTSPDKLRDLIITQQLSSPARS